MNKTQKRLENRSDVIGLTKKLLSNPIKSPLISYYSKLSIRIRFRALWGFYSGASQPPHTSEWLPIQVVGG